MASWKPNHPNSIFLLFLCQNFIISYSEAPNSLRIVEESEFIHLRPRSSRNAVKDKPLGPSFHVEPDATVFYFSNDTGGILDCSAHGKPSPSITWRRAWSLKKNQQISEDNVITPNSNSNLIKVLAHNQSLAFEPFSASQYDTNIHDYAAFRCAATSSSGRVVSTAVKVKAVFRQDTNLHIQSSYPVIPGNPVLLRCAVNSALQKFIKVEEWRKDGETIVSANRLLPGNSRYVYLSESGDLVILRVDLTDSLISYRCLVSNKLVRNGTELSPGFSLQIQSSILEQPPFSIFEKTSEEESTGRERLTSEILAPVGKNNVLIPCFTCGSPVPMTSWFRESSQHLLEPLSTRTNHRITELNGALLISRVKAKDFGRYRCVSRNSKGETALTYNLSPPGLVPALELTPKIQTVNIGAEAKISCKLKSKQADGTLSDMLYSDRDQIISMYELIWLKDGYTVRKTSTSTIISGESPYEITLKISRIALEDAGVYQCFLVKKQKNSDNVPEENTKTFIEELDQESAEIRIGDASPTLMYTFIEQTIQPGPMVSLKCKADGAPTPQIKWLLDGFDLPETERLMIGQYVTVHGEVISHLNISTSKLEDGGVYSCLAENRAGSSIHSARLNVYGPPMVRKFAKSPLTAVEGRPFSIQCPAAGYPLESIEWKKDGNILHSSSSPHLRVFPENGTLILLSVSRNRDRGTYSCSAKNRRSQSKAASVSLVVIVAPQISPFNVPATLQIGDRLSLTCNVFKGNRPLDIRWLKDERPISDSSGGVSVMTIDEFTSMLSVASLKVSHNGRYTCRTDNAAGQTEFSRVIRLNVPPSWRQKPLDIDTVVGRKIELPCAATGSPPPKILWKRESKSTLGEYKTFFSARTSSSHGFGNKANPYEWRIITPRNGEYSSNEDDGLASSYLVVDRARSFHSGNYMCQVSNSVGQDLNQMVRVNVKAPPEIQYGFPTTKIAEGEFSVVSTSVGKKTVQLECEAKGDKPISVTWKKNGINVLSSNSRGRFSMETLATVDKIGMEGVKSILTLVSVVKEDEAEYKCQMENPYGKDEAVIALIVQEPPSPPENLKSIQVKTRAVLIVWDPVNEQMNLDKLASKHVQKSSSILQTAKLKTSNNLPIEMFHVQIAPLSVPWDLVISGEKSEKGDVKSMEVSSQRTSLNIVDLRPYVEYKVRIAAENALGIGQYGQELRFRTMGSKPNGKARNIRVVSTSSESLFIKWEDPESQFWNGVLIAYKIGWRFISFSALSVYPSVDAGSRGIFKSLQMPLNWTEVEREDSSDLQFELTDLTPSSVYELAIKPLNEFGEGPVEYLRVQTLGEIPNSAPEIVSCSGKDAQTLEIGLKALSVEEARGEIIRYNVYFRDVHLGKNSGVFYLDQPRNTLADGNASNIIAVEMDVGEIGFANYSLFTSATTKTGEGPIAQGPSQVELHEPRGKYQKSMLVFCKTKQEVPNRPRMMAVSAKSPKSVIVRWLPPKQSSYDDDGGEQDTKIDVMTFTIYVRYRNGQKMETKPHQFRATSKPDRKIYHSIFYYYEIGMLQPGLTYQFWVTASNAGGESDPSPILTFNLPQDQKEWAKPIILPLNHTIGAIHGSSLLLSCRHIQQTDPGLASSRNEFTWYKDRATDIRMLFAENRIWTTGEDLKIKNLKAEDEGNYTCKVKNRFGETSVNFEVIVFDVPKSPSITVDAFSSSTITLNITSEAPNCLPLLTCTIFYKQLYGTLRSSRILPFKDRTSMAGTDTKVHLKGLQCGRVYQIYARCSNRIGPGEISAQLSQNTMGDQPKTVPAAEFIRPSNDSVRLDLYKWKEASGVCPLTYFIIEYRQKGDYDWQLVSNNLNSRIRRYSIRQLIPDEYYELKITANNDAGSSQETYTFQAVSMKDSGERLGSGSSLDGSLSGSNGHEEYEESAQEEIFIWISVGCGIVLVAVLVILTGIFFKKRNFSTRKRVYLQSEENLASASGLYQDPSLGSTAADLDRTLGGYKSTTGTFRGYEEDGVTTGLVPELPLPTDEAIYADPNFAPPFGQQEESYNPQRDQTGPSSLCQPLLGGQEDCDTMGKIPQGPDDIHPYATFMFQQQQSQENNKEKYLPELQPYSELPMTQNSKDTGISRGGTVRNIDTLIFQQNVTLPLSDANSKSSATYQSVHRPKRRRKRLSRPSIPRYEESDSDYIPPPPISADINQRESKRPGSNHHQPDFSSWDPSPKKKNTIHAQPNRVHALHNPSKVNQVKNTINHQGTLDSTSYSSEEEETEDFEGAQEYEDEDDETVVNEESITTDQGEPSPISEEERIFIKQDNGHFIAVRPSQVVLPPGHRLQKDSKTKTPRKKSETPLPSFTIPTTEDEEDETTLNEASGSDEYEKHEQKTAFR